MNEEKLNAFVGRVVEEIGATFNAGLVVIGDKLGLCRALAGAGPLTPGKLAHDTDTRERFVRHDMGDPVGAARHVLGSLAPDGTWLIVEPFANDRVEENLNPIGRVYYGASTTICNLVFEARP